MRHCQLHVVVQFCTRQAAHATCCTACRARHAPASRTAAVPLCPHPCPLDPRQTLPPRQSSTAMPQVRPLGGRLHACSGHSCRPAAKRRPGCFLHGIGIRSACTSRACGTQPRPPPCTHTPAPQARRCRRSGRCRCFKSTSRCHPCSFSSQFLSSMILLRHLQKQKNSKMKQKKTKKKNKHHHHHILI